MAYPALFTPFSIGPYTLRNRLVMAPLTRQRAGADDVPTALNVEYYSQRASAGLIITEATQVGEFAKGYAWTPGIYSAAQINAWKTITDAVHAQGGTIFLQLWHTGRISHPALLQGQQPVSASALAPDNATAFIVDEQGPRLVAPPTPRALELEEIPAIVAQFAHAARNALAAGFDGVEVHGANGYLLDQFLESGSNQRQDQYGGSPENRARLLLEVTDAIIEVWGAQRVGVRLSPFSSFNGMSDAEPEQTFGYATDQLAQRQLAYLHLIDHTASVGPRARALLDDLRQRFPGPLILAGGYSADPAAAVALLEQGKADLLAFGQAFIANPDLPKRLALGVTLNAADPNTFYGGDARGYTDYPSYSGD